MKGYSEKHSAEKTDFKTLFKALNISIRNDESYEIMKTLILSPEYDKPELCGGIRHVLEVIADRLQSRKGVPNGSKKIVG